jgi:hypothetical protein
MIVEGHEMKKRKGISVEDVERWLKQGYGQGVGKQYRSFFHVRDVPSRGRSSMVLGLKTGRVHHYLSDLEYACHILAEYAGTVTDIREQFALLTCDDTQRIAEGLGVRHPVYPGTKTPIVMTSDLVLTIQKEQAPATAVLCVKPFSEIDPTHPNSRRTMEKLLIEKTFWTQQNVAWYLITEREIPANRVKNLRGLRMGMIATELDWLNAHMDGFLSEFNSSWRNGITLFNILSRVAARINITREDCFSLFARAVWLRLLNVDLDSGAIHHDKPLSRAA